MFSRQTGERSFGISTLATEAFWNEFNVGWGGEAAGVEWEGGLGPHKEFSDWEKVAVCFGESAFLRQ